MQTLNRKLVSAPRGPLLIFYIDDSGDEQLSCFSALGFPESAWRANSDRVRAKRKALKTSDGIFLRTELHATDFVAGRGRIGENVVSKWRRCQIFDECLDMVAGLEGARLINVALKCNEDRAFERLLNRINRNAEKENCNAILICDEGKEGRYTKMCRRMKVFNPIPSRFGQWEAGDTHKNLTLDRIIEDPIFKRSATSSLIQMADLCAYALLRRERPLPSKSKYGLDKSFYRLKRIMVRAANGNDPYGVVR